MKSVQKIDLGLTGYDELFMNDAERKENKLPRIYDASVCLEGAIIVLACIIFSVFASSPPVVDPDAAAASMVWSYIGELIFNMLILVGAVKMADRLVKEMMGI